VIINEGKIQQREVFIDEVACLKEKTITEREADELIVYTEALIKDLRTESTLVENNKTDCR